MPYVPGNAGKEKGEKFAFIRLLVIVKMKKRKKPVVDVQGARLKSKLNPERGC